MPCEAENIDGMDFIICRGRRGGGQRCAYCHRSHTRLCDFEVSEGKTCDVPMCDFCTFNAGRNLDYCRDHRPGGQSKPRRDENAPRWMKALFSGVCRLCGKTVWKDEKMLWFKKGKRLYCEPCGKFVVEKMKENV